MTMMENDVDADDGHTYDDNNNGTMKCKPFIMGNVLQPSKAVTLSTLET
jgi:hypothetical protein